MSFTTDLIVHLDVEPTTMSCSLSAIAEALGLVFSDARAGAGAASAEEEDDDELAPKNATSELVSIRSPARSQPERSMG